MAREGGDKVDIRLRKMLSKTTVRQYTDIYNLHEICYIAFYMAGFSAPAQLSSVIKISEYASNIVRHISEFSAPHNDCEIALACLRLFYYQDILIDLTQSDATGAWKLISSEIDNSRILLPDRLGRTLYDRFNSWPDTGRIEYLDPTDGDELLKGSEQGIYQVGHVLTGPLGVIESEENRFIPPRPYLPLWHCADTGCKSLHNVQLLPHPNTTSVVVDAIKHSAQALFGPPSDWEFAARKLSFESKISKRRNQYDVAYLIGDTVFDKERKCLLSRALRSSNGKLLRNTLASSTYGKSLASVSADVIAEKLTDQSRLQLLMVLGDRDLVSILDRCVRAEEVRVPATEVRRSKTSPPKISRDDLRSEISMLGVRGVEKQPLVTMAAMIWDEYKTQAMLADLEGVMYFCEAWV